MKYAMCPKCGRRLCKGENGTKVEMECPKCGEFASVKQLFGREHLRILIETMGASAACFAIFFPTFELRQQIYFEVFGKELPLQENSWCLPIVICGSIAIYGFINKETIKGNIWWGIFFIAIPLIVGCIFDLKSKRLK